MASGMMGAMVWLLLVGLFYRQTGTAAKCFPTSEGQSCAAALLGAMTAYVIQAQFNPDTIVPTLAFWLFLAYTAALPAANGSGTLTDKSSIGKIAYGADYTL